MPAPMECGQTVEIKRTGTELNQFAVVQIREAVSDF